MSPDLPTSSPVRGKPAHAGHRLLDADTRADAHASSSLAVCGGRAFAFAWLLVTTACGGGSTGPTPPPQNGPAVTAISPNSGPSLGGTLVTVTGQRFEPAATVTIGGVEATGVAFVSANQLTAVTGPHNIGTTDVAVTVGGVRGILPNGFTYTASGAVTNAPPVVSRLTAVGSRPNEPTGFADADEEITVTAMVTDAETSVDKLAFEWASDAGTIAGTGASVKWRAPALFGAPVRVNVTVTVIEKYTGTDAGGNPVPQEHRVSGVTSVSVHDSVKEIGDLATAFLTDFSNSSVRPEDAVRHFYGGCPGKEAELGDIIDNRAKYRINSHSLGSPTVSVNFKGTCAYRAKAGDACIALSCEWNSTVKATGAIEIARGTCFLTSVYRDAKWQLCDSNFQSSSGTASPFMR